MKAVEEIDYLPRDIQRISWSNNEWELYHYTKDEKGGVSDKWHLRNLCDRSADYMTIDDLRSLIELMKEISIG